jgi:hypothetical protein
MSSNNQGYTGYLSAQDKSSEYNSLVFTITQVLNRRHHATLVQVGAVKNAGGVSPVGFVDVLPLVNQLDGDNNAVPHNVVHQLPYFRVQGGTDAMILDPKVGDLGLAIFADKDISSVKANKAASNPGSFRRGDMADGLYMGGFLNGTPTQFVRFSTSGIDIVSPSKVTVTAPNVEVDAQTATVNAGTSAAITSPSITLGASGQSLLSFVTSAFQSLFNGHTHASSGAGIPNQQMGSSHMTSTVKGG